MRFEILSLFPEVFEPYLSIALIGRARGQKLLEVNLHNIRDYTNDKHKTVDDTPYGGGAGMVMKIEPIDKALKAVTKSRATAAAGGASRGPRVRAGTSTRGVKASDRTRVVVLSARGQQFTQAKAQEYSKLDSLILVCGRYEGIDQRVVDYLADEELSIGPYVLAGGELPALLVLEATARLIPGVLGNPNSLAEESFSSDKLTHLPAGRQGYKANEANVEYPQYTKPADYNGWKVPDILLSGNHEEIRRWRGLQRRMLN